MAKLCSINKLVCLRRAYSRPTGKYALFLLYISLSQVKWQKTLFFFFFCLCPKYFSPHKLRKSPKSAHRPASSLHSASIMFRTEKDGHIPAVPPLEKTSGKPASLPAVLSLGQQPWSLGRQAMAWLCLLSFSLSWATWAGCHRASQ